VVSSSRVCALKMGPVGCPKTSVTNYHSTLCKISEERRSDFHCGGSLKSEISVVDVVYLNCA
jgi:hypothetical protein